MALICEEVTPARNRIRLKENHGQDILIGREDEQLRLRQFFYQALAVGGQLAFVAGEAGNRPEKSLYPKMEAEARCILALSSNTPKGWMKLLNATGRQA